MLKKYSTVAFAGLLLGVLAGCGGTSSSVSSETSTSTAPTPVTLKVWGPQKEQELLAQFGEEFQTLHPEWDLTYDFGVVEEPDLKATLLTDQSVGADVFSFPDDQLADLVGANALFQVQQYKDDVTARNTEASVASATFNDTLYAYPETADNGYFMFYDSSAISLEQMGSLDSIISVAQAQGKKVLFDPAGGWQSASFFLNSSSNIAFDGTNQTCDWNNAAGLAAAQGMWNAFGSGVLLNSGDSISLFNDGTILAAVTGTWNAEGISTSLGANYAATKMPTYTNGNDEQVQLGSFTGSKLVGVKAGTTFPAQAHAFANYITTEAAQVARYESRGLGPSNLNAGQDESILSNVALAALAAQAPYGSSQVTSVGGTYWTPAGAFAAMCYAQDLGEYANLQAALDAMVSQIVTTNS